MPSLSLIKIAKLAGVSRSTVSRVINDHPNVSDDVREKVQAIIRETGYQPNLSARSLRSRRSNVIGLVLPQSMGTLFSDPYFPVIIQGVAKGCNDKMLTLALFIEDDDQNVVQRIAQEGFLDGFILQSVKLDDDFSRRIEKTNIPYVLIGRPAQEEGVTYLDVDNETGAMQAVKHLIRLGYKKIATITGDMNSSSGLDRLIGYKKTLTDHGIEINERLIRYGDFDETKAYRETFKLIDEGVDAIFIASDRMARGAVRAIQETGLKVPEDIAIVGYDDLAPATAANPMLSTIHQPVFEFGKKAVEVLVKIINQEDVEPEKIIMETNLVIRDSCGAKL